MVESCASFLEAIVFLNDLFYVCVAASMAKNAPACEKSQLETPSFSSSLVPDTGNSKLGESTGLKCSTSLFMHDLILASIYIYDYADV